VGGIISEWVGGIIPESWAACSGIRSHHRHARNIEVELGKIRHGGESKTCVANLASRGHEAADERGFRRGGVGTEIMAGDDLRPHAQFMDEGRLHGRAIASIVKKGAARLGFDVQAFGAHSLRSGLVTSAVKRGVSLLKICDQTRHKSIEMLRTYCRDAELFVGNAAAGLL
jgi:hypothetical protein